MYLFYYYDIVRTANTAIKIAFVLQTNVKYYSFPESLQV